MGQNFWSFCNANFRPSIERCGRRFHARLQRHQKDAEDAEDAEDVGKRESELAIRATHHCVSKWRRRSRRSQPLNIPYGSSTILQDPSAFSNFVWGALCSIDASAFYARCPHPSHPSLKIQSNKWHSLFQYHDRIVFELVYAILLGSSSSS